jgi:hypothetical protein
MIDKDKIGVHQHHCCIIHGCKYGDNDCPVVNAEVLQKFLCESCNYDNDMLYIKMLKDKPFDAVCYDDDTDGISMKKIKLLYTKKNRREKLYKLSK